MASFCQSCLRKGTRDNTRSEVQNAVTTVTASVEVKAIWFIYLELILLIYNRFTWIVTVFATDLRLGPPYVHIPCRDRYRNDPREIGGSPACLLVDVTGLHARCLPPLWHVLEIAFPSFPKQNCFTLLRSGDCLTVPTLRSLQNQPEAALRSSAASARYRSSHRTTSCTSRLLSPPKTTRRAFLSKQFSFPGNRFHEMLYETQLIVRIILWTRAMFILNIHSCTPE